MVGENITHHLRDFVQLCGAWAIEAAQVDVAQGFVARLRTGLRQSFIQFRLPVLQITHELGFSPPSYPHGFTDNDVAGCSFALRRFSIASSRSPWAAWAYPRDT